MGARIENPGLLLPEATAAVGRLVKAVMSAGVPPRAMELAHLRTSQINGCSYCVSSGASTARKAGESEERLFAVAAWRETPWFDEAERAALALAEAMTRLSDRADAVPDHVWDEAARHFDQRQLAALVLWIGVSNFFNRVNVATRQPAGEVHWG